MPPSGLPLRVRWSIDGQQFNGPTDERGRDWVIDKDTGWSASPPVRDAQATPRIGAHGSWPAAVYRDPRTIRLDGWVYAPTFEARRDAEHRLAGLCAEPGRLYELRCTEETGDLIAGVVQDDTTLVTIGGGGYWLDFSLQLSAPDPRKYDGAEQTTQTGLSTDGAGLDFAAGGGAGLDFTAGGGAGLDFGPQASTGRATVTNTGTANTAPRLTLLGPLIAPVTISRPDNQARLSYLDHLGDGEQIVIDIAARTVLRGTTAVRHRTIVSDWDALTVPPHSTVDYALGHGWGPNPTARLQVAWRSAWW